MKPKISVCLPTYNGAEFVKECIEAVQQQHFYEWELIIVDDQSKDATFQIVEEIAYHDDRIKLYQNEKNLGLVGNWNRCLELANCSWIKFVFQDDMILPHCLGTLYENCVLHNCNIGICNRRYVIEADADPGVKKYILNDLIKLDTYRPESGVIDRSEIANIVAKHPLLNIFGEPTSLIFHERLLDEYGNFNQDLSQVVDYDFMVRMASNDGCFWTTQALNFFRIHGGNQTNKNKGDARSETKRKKIEYVDAILLLHDFLYNVNYHNLVKAEEHKKIITEKYLAEIAKGLDQLGRDDFETLITPYASQYENIIPDFDKAQVLVA